MTLHSNHRALAYAARLLFCGAVGITALMLSVSTVAGIAYVWFMTGYSPWAQVREWGLAAPFAWIIIGVGFAGVSVLVTFAPDSPLPRIAIAAITLGLAALWVLAVRRALPSLRRSRARAARAGP